VHINVDVVILNGSIITNGSNNNGGSGTVFAAGAGGSIYITATQVSGAGTLTASGGSTTVATANYYYGPGGGGRIAVYTSGIYITDITVDHGPFVGGNSVTITGAGFYSGTKFYFGSNLATDVVIEDENTATMTVPSGVPGAVNVSAVNFNAVANRGTKADAGTNTAQNGTIYMPDGIAIGGYRYDDIPISVALDPICSDELVLSILPTPTGVISNGSCTVSVSSGYYGYSLSLSTNESTWDINYPFQPIGNGTTTGTIANPIALTPGTIGFAVPKTQTHSTGLIASGFDPTYSIVSSVPIATHTNKYAAIPVDTDPILIKKLTTIQTNNDTTFILGASADLLVPADTYSFTILVTVVGN